MNPTITAQRTCEKAQGLVVRRRNEWGAARSYTDENPITYPAAFVFLHITVTNPSAYSSEDRHMRAIEGIGISRFPNTGISYNMIVMPSGRIFEGQPVGRRGAHTVNDKNLRTCNTSGCPSKGTSLGSVNNLNWNTRAIAIAQNVGDPVSSAQVHSIAKIAATWKRCGYVARTARFHGHRCVAWKDCPGGKAWALMATINKLIEHYTVNGIIPTPPPEDDMPTPAELWSHKLIDPHDNVARPAGDLLRFARIDAYKAFIGTRALEQLVVEDASNDITQEDLDAAKAEIIAKIEAEAAPVEPPVEPVDPQ
jgi:hypothetical protein